MSSYQENIYTNYFVILKINELSKNVKNNQKLIIQVDIIS